MVQTVLSWLDSVHKVKGVSQVGGKKAERVSDYLGERSHDGTRLNPG